MQAGATNSALKEMIVLTSDMESTLWVTEGRREYSDGQANNTQIEKEPQSLSSESPSPNERLKPVGL